MTTPITGENLEKACWRKVPTEDGGNTMDQTASILPMDRCGQAAGKNTWGESIEVRLQMRRRLIARAPT